MFKAIARALLLLGVIGGVALAGPTPKPSPTPKPPLMGWYFTIHPPAGDGDPFPGWSILDTA